MAPVERTFSEFMLSACSQRGRAATGGKVAASGVRKDDKLQDGHMRDVTVTSACWV